MERKKKYQMLSFNPDLHGGAIDFKEPSACCWADYLNDLPDRERQIVGLYIVRGLALHRIGKLYGFSESRAAQIVTKALKTLRGNMQ
jgi:RNA polymerase sigma factor for flagellar operon FliA